MTARFNNPRSHGPGLRKRDLAAYFGGIGFISMAAALAAPGVSPVVLGAGLMVLLSLIGLLVFVRLRSRFNSRPTWRDAMPGYLTVLNPNLRIIDSNEVFRRVFGDRLGERCFRVYKGVDKPCSDCAAQRTFLDGQVHTSEETVRSRNGDVINMVVTSAPLSEVDGQVSAVTAVATDVTEITTLQRELDQTRRDYERLFAAVPCFICVLGRDHRIIDANDLYRNEFGATGRSLCYEVCKMRTTQCPDCIVDKTFADGKSHSSEETLITRDGDRFNVVVHTRPVLDDHGEISAVMEVFTDITEVKKLQRQLALMGRAVAGMAHRVKNILMGLEGGMFVVNTGLETGNRESIDEGWEMVERNVQRVSRIVKDLLYCSKDRAPEFADNVCPHDIVLEVRDLYADRMREENIEVRTELSQPPHCGTFNPEGLHSLMCNLVANAIDACRFDPSEDKNHHTITLRCRQNKDGATILEVEDDGAGIPDGLNNRVFEDFFSSKGTEGTGIGLLVVQKVAEEHGGKVTLNSSPGRGATFTVNIPSAPTGKSHEEMPPPVEATTS